MLNSIDNNELITTLRIQTHPFGPIQPHQIDVLIVQHAALEELHLSGITFTPANVFHLISNHWNLEEFTYKGVEIWLENDMQQQKQRSSMAMYRR